MRALLIALLALTLAPSPARGQAEPASRPLAPAPQPAIAPEGGQAGDAEREGAVVPTSFEPPATRRLVAGAPLGDPDIAVHVIERKRFRDAGRHELTLYPAAVQANVKFTEHVGSALAYTYHLYEHFGLQLTQQYNWYTNESAFNHELIRKVREEAQAATSLLLVWGALGGVEVTPLYGKFAFYEGTLGHFTLVMNGGVGAGATRHQLRPEVEGRPATYGDAGTKLLGAVGAGLRFQLGERFAFRLELRDLVYTARVDQVNGCNLEELSAMDALISTGERHLSGRVAARPSCQVERFEGVDPRSGESRGLDVPLAKALVEMPTSDVLNNVGLYAGFSFLF